MINLNEIPFSNEAIEKINTSVINYWRFANIDIDIQPQGDTVQVVVSQVLPASNGKVLSDSELIDRGNQMLEGLMPEGFVHVITAIPYKQ